MRRWEEGINTDTSKVVWMGDGQNWLKIMSLALMNI
jgi:hypothetical protein